MAAYIPPLDSSDADDSQESSSEESVSNSDYDSGNERNAVYERHLAILVQKDADREKKVQERAQKAEAAQKADAG